MRPLIALLLALSTILAGCAADPEPTDDRSIVASDAPVERAARTSVAETPVLVVDPETLKEQVVIAHHKTELFMSRPCVYTTTSPAPGDCLVTFNDAPAVFDRTADVHNVTWTAEWADVTPADAVLWIAFLRDGNVISDGTGTNAASGTFDASEIARGKITTQVSGTGPAAAKDLDVKFTLRLLVASR